jgi:hypothetical protein
MRLFAAILLVLTTACMGLAQDPEPGWTFYGRLQGSSNGSGVVLKADPSVGYRFNNHFEAYAGLPAYFVNQSSGGAMNGIGNAYLGFTLLADNPSLRYTSNLVATAPTGDKDRGFSTGRVTVDWTNTFSRRFSSFMPYASAGIANTVSDTSFFVRPFSSLGLVSHFDGGALISLGNITSVGASGYAVRASGEQRVISKVIQRRESTTGRGRGSSGRVFETEIETVGPAEIANDHGFSMWLSVSPTTKMDFQIGYNRSVRYELDSLFFGIGFRVGK